jgi:hypothetical protein
MLALHQSNCRASMAGFWPSETEPDNRLFSVINYLPPNCRVCRVFIGVETRRKPRFFCSDFMIVPYFAHMLGLE